MTRSNLQKEEFIWDYSSRGIKYQSQLGNMTAGRASWEHTSSTASMKQREFTRNVTRLSKPQSLPPVISFLHQGHTSSTYPTYHQQGTKYSNIWAHGNHSHSNCHRYVINITYNSINFTCLLPCLWDARLGNNILFLSIFWGHLEKRVVLGSID